MPQSSATPATDRPLPERLHHELAKSTSATVSTRVTAYSARAACGACSGLATDAVGVFGLDLSVRNSEDR